MDQLHRHVAMFCKTECLQKSALQDEDKYHIHTDTQSVNNYLLKKDKYKTITHVVKQKKIRKKAISNGIGQFVFTCCLLFNL